MSNHHQHCGKCVSSTCTFTEDDCSIVACPNCGIKSHKCKLEEHVLYICPHSVVKCINFIYGCNEDMRRSRLGIHLEHCPASVLKCPFVYQRWEMDHYNPPIPACELPDEKFFQNDKDFVLSNSSSYNSLNKMSIQCIADYQYYCEAREYRREFSYSGKHYDHVNLNHNIYQYHTHRDKGIIPCHLFVCGEYIRRDQFQSHMVNHLELVIDLSMKVSRCPLYCFGCEFGSVLYHPLTETGCGYLDYSNFMSSFIIKSHPLTLTTLDCTTINTITTFPLEVILYILSYLDSLSFWNLSQVCRYFRNLCQEYLTSKGIVYFTWKKKYIKQNEEEVEIVKWFEEHKKWRFPKSFAPAITWLPNKDLFSINSHLMSTCSLMRVSYNKSNVIDLLNNLNVSTLSCLQQRTATNPQLLSLKRNQKKDYIFVNTTNS